MTDKPRMHPSSAARLVLEEISVQLKSVWSELQEAEAELKAADQKQQDAWHRFNNLDKAATAIARVYGLPAEDRPRPPGELPSAAIPDDGGFLQ